MKEYLKHLFVSYLAWCARHTMKRWKPIVIAIAGSIGKTTTKDMIASVLSTTYAVKKTEGNLNSDIGLPLTVLGLATGGGIFFWMGTSIKAFFASFQCPTEQYFVVEMGADKPGDIVFLTSIVKPTISVITNVSASHLAEGQFANEEAISKEKGNLITCLQTTDTAVLNGDNFYTRNMIPITKGKIVLYGKENADVCVGNIDTTIQGITFDVTYKDVIYPFTSSVLADFLVYAFLPAISIGFLLNVPVEKMKQAIALFVPPKGRFNKLEGINGSIIIDSSYNASPMAVQEAVHAFSHIQGKRKIIVQGNMNELGENSIAEHQKIGEFLAPFSDLLITIGKDAIHISKEAKKNNPLLETHHFTHHSEVSSFLKSILHPNDIVLVKGSQNNVFLEETVKTIMLHPECASDLLVRQGKEWEGKK